MVEVFLSIIEQMMAVKEFIKHVLVPDLNHLDGLCKDLRSKDSLAFLRLT